MAVLLFAWMATMAQNYPSEWVKYTSDGYFHAVESGVNDQKMPEERFRDDLLNRARTNLAKQIRVNVHETIQMNKDVLDGKTIIYYESRCGSYTDVVMTGAESRSHVDVVSGRQYVIVYINKADARRYYVNEAEQLISGIDNKLEIAENYINAGFKSEAKKELDSALISFDKAAEILFWLNVSGMTDTCMKPYRDRLNQQEQVVKQKIADMKFAINIYLNCKADLSGNSYPTLANTIKGELSEIGCTFVTSAAEADWAIYVTANAREYNAPTIGGHTTYFAYIDATLAIDKVVTNQRIYEDALTEKGGHTHNYTEAARDGYKQIAPKIIALINQYIKQ